MSICLFWSNYNEKVNCYEECPMIEENVRHEGCCIQQHLIQAKMFFNDDKYNEIFEDELV